jgi:glucose/arabinose dehydrogenase
MRTFTARALAVLLLVTVSSPIASPPAAAASRIRAVAVASDLNVPVGFTFLPGGVLVYVELHTGTIYFRNLATGVDRRVFRIPAVDADGTGGAIGLEVHPAWPTRRVLYAFATRDTQGGLRNQILRINLATRRSRVILSAVAHPSSDHHGGRILFGADRNLYVVIGDDGRAAYAQDLSRNLRGKVLRIGADGSIPPGNPFGNRVWAYGIRNSVGLAFDPLSGRLWQTDNGPECNDEVNRIRRGGNHGWGPSADCPATNNSGPTPRFLPAHVFATPVGITGLAFCDGCGLGVGIEGDLFVADFNGGRIRRFQLNATRTSFDAGPVTVIDHPAPVATLSIEVAPDGRMYFSTGAKIFRLVRTQ